MAKSRKKLTVIDAVNGREFVAALDNDVVAVSGEGKDKRWVQIESTAPTVVYAERLIDWFLEDRMGETIQFPITVQIRPLNAKSKSRYGHFSLSPTWETREGHQVWEIVLAAEHLSRDPYEVVTTILHEAVHVYNLARGEADASKSGRHNQVFKDAAEAGGLVVESHKGRGFVTTGITAELKKQIDSKFPIDAGLLRLFHQAYQPKPKAAPKRMPYTCACGDFKLQVPAKQTLDATCNVCNEKFVREEIE